MRPNIVETYFGAFPTYSFVDALLVDDTVDVFWVCRVEGMRERMSPTTTIRGISVTDVTHRGRHAMPSWRTGFNLL